jgi:hypothetical protein
MKVLEIMNKKREIAQGGKVNGNLIGADKQKKPATVMKKSKKRTGKKN